MLIIYLRMISCLASINVRRLYFVLFLIAIIESKYMYILCAIPFSGYFTLQWFKLLFLFLLLFFFFFYFFLSYLIVVVVAVVVIVVVVVVVVDATYNYSNVNNSIVLMKKHAKRCSEIKLSRSMYLVQ